MQMKATNYAKFLKSHRIGNLCFPFQPTGVIVCVSVCICVCVYVVPTALEGASFFIQLVRGAAVQVELSRPPAMDDCPATIAPHCMEAASSASIPSLRLQLGRALMICTVSLHLSLCPHYYARAIELTNVMNIAVNDTRNCLYSLRELFELHTNTLSAVTSRFGQLLGYSQPSQCGSTKGVSLNDSSSMCGMYVCVVNLFECLWGCDSFWQFWELFWQFL